MGDFSRKFVFNKYLILVLIYFFFNSIFLPHGLLYTMLLAPLFYISLLKKSVKNILGYFLIVFMPFALIHFINGCEWIDYIRSTTMAFLVFLFGFSLYTYLKSKTIDQFFPIILKLNFLLFAIGVVMYYTPWIEYFWMVKNLTIEIKNFSRFKLFTYEPSYYSLVFAPIAIYYGLSLFLYPTKWKNAFFYFVLVIIPLLFSFSLGVISCLSISFFLFFIFKFIEVVKKKRVFYALAFSSIALLVLLLVLLVLFPENPLYSRIVDLFEGKDTSASGRTTQAIYLAYNLALRENLWFGVGFGQIKIVGAEYIRDFYNYSITDQAALRIPNAIGETLAMFGLAGLGLRLLLQGFLFYKTKVSTNYFRFCIFIFVFIYQFTGSFFINTAEIVLWVIAFSPSFKAFDKNNFNSTTP